ncbi:MAG TPA: hypothetical protein VIL97_10650, partial [Thermoanaerobaculia bacterium]
TTSDNTLAGRQSIALANDDGTNVVAIYTGTGLGSVSLSPDQTTIAFTEGGLFQPRNLHLIGTMPGSKKRQISSFDRGWIYQQQWLPDGKHLLAARSYEAFLTAPVSDLAVVSAESGVSRRVTMNLNMRFNHPTVSADGKRVVATAETYEREIWRVPITGTPEQNGAGAQLLVKEGNPMWIHAPAGSRDLLFNSTAHGGSNLFVMPMDGGALPRQLTFNDSRDITHCALSPDGTRIAYALFGKGSSQIYVANLDGSSARRLTSGPGIRYWPIWSPDSRFIAYTCFVPAGGPPAAHRVLRVPVAGGREESITTNSGFFRGDWSPDGRTIVGYRDPGELQLLDVATGSYKVLAGGRWSWSLPVWNRAGTKVAAARAETALSDAIWIIDARTGAAKKAAVFRGLFHIRFRTPFTPDEHAVIVNREETVSNIVLLENL